MQYAAWMVSANSTREQTMDKSFESLAVPLHREREPPPGIRRLRRSGFAAAAAALKGWKEMLAVASADTPHPAAFRSVLP